MIPRPRGSLELRRGYHSPQLELEVRLNTNESPFPPPEGFSRRLAERISKLSLNRYPDRSYRMVREALGGFVGVGADRIFVGNGSNEVLLNVALGYGGPGRRAVVFEPTYSLHAHIATKVSTEVTSLPRSSDYRITVDEYVLPSIETASLVYLCTPNNPTGIVEDPQDVLRIVAHSRGLVVLDEAYGDFSAQTRANVALMGDSVISVRTFSKWFSLAGLRFGYSIAHPEVTATLDEVVLPYHFDQIKQAAVLTVLEMVEEFDAQSAMLVHHREELRRGIAELGIATLPSSTNFLLMLLPGRDASLLWRRLVERSVLVRDTTGWPGLPSSLRVTVGSQTENARFLEAFATVLTA